MENRKTKKIQESEILKNHTKIDKNNSELII